MGKSQDGSDGSHDGSPMETFLDDPALMGLRRRSPGLPGRCKALLLGVQVKMGNIQIFQKENSFPKEKLIVKGKLFLKEKLMRKMK